MQNFYSDPQQLSTRIQSTQVHLDSNAYDSTTDVFPTTTSPPFGGSESTSLNDSHAMECRGAGRKNFLSNFLDLTRQYKQDLVILTETKITGDNVANIIPKFGFRNSISLADEGLSGGIL